VTKATSSRDSLSTIGQSTFFFFSGTMLSRISGMFRDISLAYAFGAHGALAALFVGFRFAHLFRRLLGEGTLQSAFIPLFEEVKAQNFASGCRFFRDLSLLWTVLVSTICLLIMGLLWLCLPLFGPETKEIVTLSLIMVPVLLPTSLFGLNSCFLQSQKEYFISAVSPLFFNLTLVLSVFVLRSMPAVKAMPLLSAAIVLAATVQYVISFVPVFRSCFQELRGQIFRGVSFFSQEIKRFWKPLSLGVIGISASQINSAIDSLFARAAETQGPAHLWFAIRFQHLPLALFGVALSNAILPPLTRAIQAGETAKFLSFVEYAIRQVFALLLPCTAILFVLGISMINCIYGHGNFDSTAIFATTQCLHGYTLALLPTGIVIVLAPIFYAQKNYTIPVRGAYLSLLLNTVLNAIMVFGFGWGAVSVTIATSISAWINAFYLYWNARRFFGPLITRKGYEQIFQLILVVFAATAFVLMILSIFFSLPPLFHYEATTLLPTLFLDKLVHLVYPMAAFGLSLFFFAKIIQVDDLFSLIRSFRSR
jgi:putative peptidoglycan lipid II flippase